MSTRILKSRTKNRRKVLSEEPKSDRSKFSENENFKVLDGLIRVEKVKMDSSEQKKFQNPFKVLGKKPKIMMKLLSKKIMKSKPKKVQAMSEN